MVDARARRSGGVVGAASGWRARLLTSQGGGSSGLMPVERESNGPLRLALLRSPSPVELPAVGAFGLADLIVRRPE